MDDIMVYREGANRVELLVSALIGVWCRHEKYIEADRETLEAARSWFGTEDQ